ncbi:NADP-dependent oxidoreductase [Aureibacillus halotolerans]|uniref:Enoyl reductase (ER) domain-containing protein n=1 Tax=Aureibacillus halotolerans TaxID=1508390 RepID=A0A4R6TXH0_9BACI|nr:NADP-dependent oxidoreductase [Aureibacillus halotolerans]TDQ37472.1 hypothetical protein EV213_113107 [Aureibacillus halotolerans]
MELKNEQLLLINRPSGLPTKEDFSFEQLDTPVLGEGEVIVRTLYLSVDPYMRGRMNDTKSYVPPFQLDQAISGGLIGEVTETATDTFAVGDLVTGILPFRRVNAVKESLLRKITSDPLPPSVFLGPLGMTGLTAYFGLLDIGNPSEGDTLVVSGAAGAVGSLVCQIGKLKGAHVVGIVGSDEKAAYLKELGVDATVNYKTDDVPSALETACPDGIDIYFDNVGGPVSDAALSLINDGARIPICGQISLYNLQKQDVGPRIQPNLLVNRALMKGFIVSDYAHRYAEGEAQLTEWLLQGKLTYRESVIDGFENTVDAFLGLFSGTNIGKQLVHVADPVRH